MNISLVSVGDGFLVVRALSVTTAFLSLCGPWRDDVGRTDRIARWDSLPIAIPVRCGPIHALIRLHLPVEFAPLHRRPPPTILWANPFVRDLVGGIDLSIWTMYAGKASEVPNGYIEDMYPGILMPTIYLSRALLSILHAISKSPSI
jgi:hypothetical protein